MNEYKSFNDMKAETLQIINKAYTMGYDDGKSSLESQQLYITGLNDAWECAKKINDMDQDMYDELFPKAFINGLYESYSISEAIAIIKEYNEKQNQDDKIKIGDEVIIFNSKGVITAITDDYKYGAVLFKDGSFGKYPIYEYKKTGRHFPDIAQVLKQLRKESEPTGPWIHTEECDRE